MKVIITGERGYIGTRLCDWLNNAGFRAERLSVRNGVTPDNFIGCGCVVHAAALVHQTNADIPYETYLDINTTLTDNIAEAALTSGVRRFVFLSSMAVYENYMSQNSALITQDTDVAFHTAYASTKYGAEELLAEYSKDMAVSVIRPPLVYGKGSPGSFGRLIKFSKSGSVFPRVDNRRSMIYIDNLCELIRLIITNEATGLFHPQNAGYMNTSQLVCDLGRLQNNRIRLVNIPSLIVDAGLKTRYGKKVFGSLAYDERLSASFDGAYNIVAYEESLARSI